ASILGLAPGQVIESVIVTVSGVGEIINLSDITAASGTLSPNISQALLDQIGAKLKADQSITATISGSSNYAPMSFNLRLAFDAIVSASPLE
ncbi:MAG: hypothetical protein HQ541_15400, partial [Mariniphaga sp.]|nr:hypothetical protein [Mariniphaga sp.]